jgi:outer membrane protein insertion porin family
LGFPTSEYASVGLRYTYRVDQITPFIGAPTAVQLAAGSANTSSIGYTYSYNTLDDILKPRHGVTFGFSQDIAGFGGTLKYLKTVGNASFYHPVLGDDFVAKLQLQGGYIQGYGGQHIRLNERFFMGGDSFRGFNIAGLGPRELNVGGGGNNAIGGEAYVIGTAELRLPDFLPSDYGISLSLFTDVGTLGHIAGDVGIKNCGNNRGGGAPCIKDNLALRASGGLAIGWKSPFGPVQIDIGIPFKREGYDKEQIIRFSAGTGL